MRAKDQTVKLDTLHPAMALGIGVLDQVAREYHLDEAVITSGQDGRHMVGSKHHQDRPDLPGEAVDMRVRDILEGFCARVRALLETLLPQTFDVLLEMTPTICHQCGAGLKGTHVHVERDPK